uniref:ImmA/IrrE family metallo-endopeptidase n=1 Tax=uncultured Allobacillus sp. TaxID=1638025 RepID=UPI002599D2E3|nr:ImmA/IrrE family metallo-endopeptidase [uncultured Allobacillus sp.]
MNTHLEDYIHNLYKHLSITEPQHLTIESIAQKLGLTVDYGSVAFRFGDFIILQETNEQQEWQQFGHEVCHYLRHHGSQLTMAKTFMQLQEYQADYFAYHFCVPTFMLDQIDNLSIHDIINLFNVEYDFAQRRFDIYENKLINMAWAKPKNPMMRRYNKYAVPKG